MKFNLIPKEEKFFELFAAQAGHCVEAARLFKEFAERWPVGEPELRRLHDIEHEGDITAHEIYDRLNRTFVTPFDREDIHALASELDDVLDLVYHVAMRMHLYRVEKSSEQLVQLAGILLDSAETLKKAILELANPAKTRRVLDHCIEINRLENAGDRTMEHAIGKLFEGKPDALEVLKWKEIYEHIENAIDKCEDVANTLESILVKQG